MKRIYLIYQDCPLCGARKEWGEAQTKIANTHGFEIVKMSFVSPKADEFIKTAVYEKHIGKLPFFTDGEKYSRDLADFVEKEEKPIKNTRKKAKNVKNK